MITKLRAFRDLKQDAWFQALIFRKSQNNYIHSFLSQGNIKYREECEIISDCSFSFYYFDKELFELKKNMA